MNHSKIGTRYAKALYQLADENKSLDQVDKDMRILLEISQSVDEFKLLIESPVIPTSKKRAIIKNLLGSSFAPDSLTFIDLVFTNKREAHIPDIVRNFIDLVRAGKGVKSAFFSSAVELGEDEKNQIKKITEEYFKTKVELHTEANSDLIGGFVLRVDDKQFDNSVSTALKNIRQKLISSDFKVKY